MSTATSSFVNSPSNEMIDFYIWDKRMTNWWDLLPDHVDIFDKWGWPKQLWILSRKKDTSVPHTQCDLKILKPVNTGLLSFPTASALP